MEETKKAKTEADAKQAADVAAHRTCYQSQSDPFSSACACSMEWHINLECAPLLTAVSAVDDHVIT